jgi:hypothetical protein
MVAEREVSFEFVQVGGAVKVWAVDAGTGVEASIVGDAATGEAALSRPARRKLDDLLARCRTRTQFT